MRDSPSPPAHSDEDPLRVLLIENHPPDAQLFREYLRDGRRPMEVRCEQDLSAGLQALRKQPIGVVVLDLGLPDSQGVDTVQRFADAAPSVPVVVLTDENTLETALASQQAGATEYLRKDKLTPSLAERTLRWAAERARMERTLRQAQRQQQAVFEDPNLLAGLLGTDGTVRDINQTALGHIGASLGEIKGERFWETPWFEGDAALQNRVRAWIRRAAAGEYVEFEADHTEAVGAPLVVEGVLRPVTDETGEVTSLLISGRDVTERKEAERRRKQVIRRGTDAIEEVDSEWRFTFANETALELYGLAEEELLGKSLWEVFSGIRGTRFEEEYRTAMRTREPTRFEAYYSELDRWFDVQVYPNADGGLAFYFEDVSERKRRERRLEALFEDSPDMIDVHDGDGTILRANPRFLEQTGYGEDDMGALKVWELDETLGPDEARQLWAGMEVGDRRRIEGRYRRNDGSTFPVEVHLRRLRLEGEDRFVAISHDITERRRRQRELRAGRDRLKTLFESLPTPVVRCVMREDGTYISDANEAFEDVFGVEAAAAEEKDLNELIVPEEKRREGGELDRRALEDAQEREVRRVAANGTRDFRLQVAGRQREGAPPEIYAIYTDVTEQKRRERALEETNSTLEAVLANLPHGVLAEDGSRRIIAANEGLCEAFGVPIEPVELEGRDCAKAVRDIAEVTADADWFADRIEEILDRGEPVFGEEIRLRDGRILERDFVPYQLSGQDAALWLYRDITERKKWERTLRRRRQVVESLYSATGRLLRAESREAVSSGIYKVLDNIFDYPFVHVGLVDEGVIVPQKTAAEGLSPKPKTEPRPTDDDLVVTRALRAGEAVVVDDIETLDNDIDYGSLSSLAGIPIGKRGAIVVGTDQEEEFDWFNLQLVEVMGRYAALVLERLDREEQLVRAKEDAEKASRLKTHMLANMSHEIRTPLTPIIGFAESLAEQLEGPEAQLAGRIEKSGKRLQQTLDSVLALSQLESGTYELSRKALDLREVVREAARRLQRATEKKGPELEADLPDHPVPGEFSEGGVRRIVENLLENAVKFTPDGGQVHVQVRSEDDTAVLEVEDTGVGISQEAQSEIFEAFQQESKGWAREYEGTGLGLSIVERLAEAHGGRVEVESEKGEGSRFIVRLPTETPPSAEDANAD